MYRVIASVFSVTPGRRVWGYKGILPGPFNMNF